VFLVDFGLTCKTWTKFNLLIFQKKLNNPQVVGHSLISFLESLMTRFKGEIFFLKFLKHVNDERSQEFSFKSVSNFPKSHFSYVDLSIQIKILNHFDRRSMQNLRLPLLRPDWNILRRHILIKYCLFQSFNLFAKWL
jgi:hypothetical protein